MRKRLEQHRAIDSVLQKASKIDENTFGELPTQ